MPLDPDALLAWRFAPAEQHLSAEACMLYALSIGIGRLDLDTDWRRHVAGSDVTPFPTMVTTLCREGPWGRWPGTGVTPERSVHVGQSIAFHRPMRCGMTIVAETRIESIEDLGVQKGAIVTQERRFFDKATGDAMATLLWTVLARADGGFGGTRRETPVAPAFVPDRHLPIAIPKDAALLYRLTGDANPIHTDPERARAAGFPAPLLHGLCLLGMATAIATHAQGKTADALDEIEARFATPVYPGETVQLRLASGDPLMFDVVGAEKTAMRGTIRFA